MAMVVLQGKVLPETLEAFKKAQENSTSETFNQFVEEILEAYLNPKTKTVEVPRPTAEQLEEIQLKENEIGRLKLDIDFKNKDIECLRTENLELNAEIESRGKAPEIEKDQVILTIPPIIKKVLEVEAQTAAKKAGKTFSIPDILLNNFWESIKNGASHPFKIWSSSELTKLANDLKAAE